MSTLGGVFSRGGVAVLLPVAMNIGRFLGPPLARALLAGPGRDSYAHVQVKGREKREEKKRKEKSLLF